MVRSRLGQDETFQEARLVKDGERLVPAGETDPAVPARFAVTILEGAHGEVAVHYMRGGQKTKASWDDEEGGGKELASDGFVLRVAVVDFVRSSSVREIDHAVRDEHDKTACCSDEADEESVTRLG